MSDNNTAIKVKEKKASPKKAKFSFKRIGARIAKFFREYKSEFKKIVWPTPKQVRNNTIVTLIMCGVVGLFIWLLDYGLYSLLQVVYNIPKAGA